MSQDTSLTRIQLAKSFVLSDNGLQQPELLADSFRFLGTPYAPRMDTTIEYMHHSKNEHYH